MIGARTAPREFLHFFTLTVIRPQIGTRRVTRHLQPRTPAPINNCQGPCLKQQEWTPRATYLSGANNATHPGKNHHLVLAAPRQARPPVPSLPNLSLAGLRLPSRRYDRLEVVLLRLHRRNEAVQADHLPENALPRQRQRAQPARTRS